MPCLPWFSYVNLLTCTNTDTYKTVPQIFTWLSCWLNDMCFWSFVLYSPCSLGGVPAGPYNFSSSFLSSTLPINSDEAQKMWMWENRMWSNCLFVISLIHLKFSDILNSGIYLDLATKTITTISQATSVIPGVIGFFVTVITSKCVHIH